MNIGSYSGGAGVLNRPPTLLGKPFVCQETYNNLDPKQALMEGEIGFIVQAEQDSVHNAVFLMAVPRRKSYIWLPTRFVR